MGLDPFTEDDRRLIVTVRERLRWIDSLPEPQRTLAIHGVPENEWAAKLDWIAATLDAIHGRTRRVWHRNPDYMKPGEPVGYWSTERVKR